MCGFLRWQTRLIALVAAALLAGAPELSSAESMPQSAAAPGAGSAAPIAVSPWRLGLALGYGERRNPLIQSDDIPVALDVDIAWFGQRAFFDNGDLGYTVMNSSSATVNLVARVNSDRVFFGKTNTRLVRIGGTSTGAQPSPQVPVRPPDRDYAIELGAELLTDGTWGRLAVSAFADASGTHDGFELSARYDARWHRQRLVLEPSLAVTYKSRALNDYYWGVRPSESNAALPSYSVGAGISAAVHLRGSYHLSRSLRLVGSASYETLSSDVRRSPLVESRGVFGYFAGIAWQFRGP
jgi:MipA family protein